MHTQELLSELVPPAASRRKAGLAWVLHKVSELLSAPRQPGVSTLNRGHAETSIESASWLRPQQSSGSTRREMRLVWLLSAVAALRVAIFSAAFPFFGNVDEAQHFDLVMKYSLGRVPRTLEPLAPESARYVGMYGSPEFLSEPGDFARGEYAPPLWKKAPPNCPVVANRDIHPPAQNVGADSVASTQLKPRAALRAETNYESSQPPLYYALAGGWLRLGRFIGIPQNGFLLYWLRLLNAFAAAALVWLGFAVARRVFPEQTFVRLGAPLLLAFFPQDTFYSIQSDVLSPLCFGAAFYGLVRWLAPEPARTPGVVPYNQRLGPALFLGIALAATCLTKTANLPLVAVAGIALVWHTCRLGTSWGLRAAAPPLMILALGVTVPLAIWFAWNLHTFGDLTASAGKIQHLGWTRKPLGAWWPHPLFTWHGVRAFWAGVMTTFWRGELTWHGVPMSRPAADIFYWLSSAAFLGAAVISSYSPLRESCARVEQRRILRLSFWSFAVLLGFFALLSVSFDFGNCPYPSREYPYFASGRLLSAVLIPVLLLYCYGLERVLSRINASRMAWVVMAGIVLLVTVSELLINSPAFASPYNLFAMVRGG